MVLQYDYFVVCFMFENLKGQKFKHEHCSVGTHSLLDQKHVKGQEEIGEESDISLVHNPIPENRGKIFVFQKLETNSYR